MSSAEVEVVFEGPGVKTGKIDARLLADALAGCSEVFTRANAVLNGDASQAAVLVQSDFKHGSFVAGLELVQNVTEQGLSLITAHHFLNAAALAGLIGFGPAEVMKELAKDIAKETVIGLFKWLKGKKPDAVKRIDNDGVEVRSGSKSKTVNVNVFNLYGDSAMRTGLDKLTLSQFTLSRSFLHLAQPGRHCFLASVEPVRPLGVCVRIVSGLAAPETPVYGLSDGRLRLGTNISCGNLTYF